MDFGDTGTPVLHGYMATEKAVEVEKYAMACKT